MIKSIKLNQPNFSEVIPGRGPFSLKLSLGGLGGGCGGPTGGRSKLAPAIRMGPMPMGPLLLPGGRGPPMFGGPKFPPNMGGPWEGGIMPKGGAMPIKGPCPMGPMPIGFGGLRWPFAGPDGGRLGGSGGGRLIGLAAARIIFQIPFIKACHWDCPEHPVGKQRGVVRRRDCE